MRAVWGASRYHPSGYASGVVLLARQGIKQKRLLVSFQVTQHIDFCYGHRLLNYAGKCRNLHGHNGRAVIVLASDQLDERGMLMDFTDIKSVVRTWIDNELDHRMILHEQDPVLPYLEQLGEPLFLLPVNPTAENIARVIFEFTKSQGFPVVEVSLWETPNAFATYRG